MQLLFSVVLLSLHRKGFSFPSADDETLLFSADKVVFHMTPGLRDRQLNAFPSYSLPLVLFALIVFVHEARSAVSRCAQLRLNLTISVVIKNPTRSVTSALRLAARDIERFVLAGCTVRLSFHDLEQCSRGSGVRAIMNDFANVSVGANSVLNAIVIDDCDILCHDISFFGGCFGINVLTFGCESKSLRRGRNFPTFATSLSFGSEVKYIITAIVDNYGWDRIVVVNIEGDEKQTLQRIRIIEHAQEYNPHGMYMYLEVPAANGSSAIWKGKVSEVKVNFRVVLLLFGKDIPAMLQFLSVANELDMFNGEYVFITIDYEIVRSWKLMSHLDFLQNGLISINPKPPSATRMRDFHERLGNFQEGRYMSSLTSNTQYPMKVVYAYETLMIWAYGFRDALEKEQTAFYRNESSLESRLAAAEYVYDVAFSSVTGRVTMNPALGDRFWDMSVQMVQSGEYVTIAEFDSATGDISEFRQDLKLIWPGGGSVMPPGYPIPCGWANEICIRHAREEAFHILQTVLLCIVSFVIAAFIVVPIALSMHSRRQVNKLEFKLVTEWAIRYKNLIFVNTTSVNANENANVTYELHFPWTPAKATGFRQPHYGRVATYQDVLVYVTPITDESVAFNDSILREISQIRSMSHMNIARFIGICIEAPNVSIVMEYGEKRTLHHIIVDRNLALDFDFMTSFLLDIAQGMIYLELSKIGSHGNLSSLACVIDSRWTCKITDFGLGNLRKLQQTEMRLDSNIRELTDEFALAMYPLWTAPELLRLPKTKRPLYGTKKGDVYSYGIIIHEVIIKDVPFAIDLQTLTPDDIVQKMKQKSRTPFRPTMLEGRIHDEWEELMQQALNENPGDRPTFNQILRNIKRNTVRASDIGEKLMLMLQMYSLHLEDLIAQRTAEAHQERHRASMLLYSLLPPIVADKLKHRNEVVPQRFDSATIGFSDIVEFTKIAAASTPLQIVQLLGTLYGLIDDIVDQRDAYKVETIGDAYMVASGLPLLNGTRHASEIAHIALDVLEAVTSFTIPHLPNKRMEVRIGIHTGPVLAGVVGIKVPRYCLFGETVSMASTVESTGLANKVHVTKATADILMMMREGFVLESRGFSIEGDESSETYFLLGVKPQESIQSPDNALAEMQRTSADQT